jgi:3-phytase
MRVPHGIAVIVIAAVPLSCSGRGVAPSPVLQPVTVTATVADDADDPAIWIDRANPERSLIVGTNKVAAPDGALYVFGLDGAVREIVKPLDRPNNVDIEYGLMTDSARSVRRTPIVPLGCRVRALQSTPAGTGDPRSHKESVSGH